MAGKSRSSVAFGRGKMLRGLILAARPCRAGPARVRGRSRKAPQGAARHARTCSSPLHAGAGAAPPPGWLNWLGDLLAIPVADVQRDLLGCAGVRRRRHSVLRRAGVRGITTRTQSQDQRREPRPGDGLSADEAKAEALLEEADRLAAEGRFDEAAHTLLYRSIEDIEKRLPRSIRKAQTSREIAGLAALPAAVRSAFAPITRAVEQSWFGGQEAAGGRLPGVPQGVFRLRPA